MERRRSLRNERQQLHESQALGQTFMQSEQSSRSTRVDLQTESAINQSKHETSVVTDVQRSRIEINTM